jgi:hypothetical protein
MTAKFTPITAVPLIMESTVRERGGPSGAWGGLRALGGVRGAWGAVGGVGDLRGHGGRGGGP